MKIATFNVNGISARLPRLLEWLAEASPDIACLQELKTSDETFPAEAIRDAGYSALWHGQKGFNGVAVLAKGGGLVERRRGLGGDPEDAHSRYLEAEAHGLIVASIYLPNGNPQPGPKFAYKLAWFERLIEHAAGLVSESQPVLLIGDYNVVPTDGKGDIYSPASWKDDALLQPETRAAYQRLIAQGWTDAIHQLHPGKPIYTFWDFFRKRFERDAGLRIDHLLLNAPAAARLKEAGVDKAVRARERPSDHAPTWVVLD
ncbi:MAG: exodeoxyribonuclease III [Caldimonas sp.]